MTRSRSSLLVLHALLCTAVVACGDDGGGDGADTDDPGSTEGPGTTGGPGTVTDSDTTGGPTSGPTSGTATQADTDSTGDSGSGSETGNVDPGEGRPDLDGDGIVDLVIGARGYDEFNGAVWIDYSADNLPDGPSGMDTQLVGEANFGMAAVLCDLDGDEIDELIAGSLDGLFVYGGGVRLDANSTEDLLITSADQLTTTGGLGCGDVTGDGMNDIVAAGATFQGWTLTVVPGSATILDNPTLDADAAAETIHIDSSGGSLLPALALGDVNDDDVFDIVIGASLDGEMTPAEGAAYVFFGGGGLTSGTEADADVTLLGSEPSSSFGSSLAAGDLDGDGIDDVAVAEQGQVRIFFGDAGFAAAPAPMGGLHARGQPQAGKMLDFSLFFGDDALPAALAILLLEEDDAVETLAMTLGPFGGFSGETAVAWALHEAEQARVCAAEIEGNDNSPPRVIPTGSSLPGLMPGPDEIAIPVTRHGRTDPATFQPDGPGKAEVIRWEEGGCQVFQAEDGTIVITGLEPTGEVETVYEDMDAWSNGAANVHARWKHAFPPP